MINSDFYLNIGSDKGAVTNLGFLKFYIPFSSGELKNQNL